jgi:hypothetical protein
MLVMGITIGGKWKKFKMVSKKTVGFIGGKFLPFHLVTQLLYSPLLE